MTFKGKSTIELRNAKTGELEFKTEDENMITNAIHNLVNLEKQTFVRTKGYRPESRFTPLINSCFGGLLLYNKPITEDVNVTFQPPDVLQVGCASGTYVGADTNRGTRNLTESVALDNGFRYVWDFATDKANGTIRCAALTSYSGGTGGLRQTDFASSSVIYVPVYYSGLNDAANGSDPKLESTGGSFAFCNDSSYLKIHTGNDTDNSIAESVFVGYFEKDIMLIAGIVSSDRKGVTLTKKKVNSSVVRLKSAGITSYENVKSLRVATTGKFNDSRQFCTDNQYLYSLYPHDNNQIDFVKINGTTLAVETDITITVQDAKFVNGSKAVYCNGKVYVKNAEITNGLSIYEINYDDPSDYRLLPVLEGFSDPDGLNVLNGMLLVDYEAYSSGKTAFFTDGVWSIGQTSHSMGWNNTSAQPCSFIESPYIKLPYVIFRSNARFNSHWYFWTNIGILTPFLSTINNLSTPVVKNETQTMKVTYEITEI